MNAWKVKGFVVAALVFAAQPLWAAQDVTLTDMAPDTDNWEVELLFIDSSESLSVGSLSD